MAHRTLTLEHGCTRSRPSPCSLPPAAIRRQAAPPPVSHGSRHHRARRPRPPSPPIPLAIDLGQSVVLNWRTTNATSVSIDGIGEVPVNGTQTVSPSNSTNFHLVAKDDGGTTEANVRVTVRVPEVPTAPAGDDTGGDMGSDAEFHAHVQDIFFDYDSYDLRPDAADRHLRRGRLPQRAPRHQDPHRRLLRRPRLGRVQHHPRRKPRQRRQDRPRQPPASPPAASASSATARKAVLHRRDREPAGSRTAAPSSPSTAKPRSHRPRRTSVTEREPRGLMRLPARLSSCPRDQYPWTAQSCYPIGRRGVNPYDPLPPLPLRRHRSLLAASPRSCPAHAVNKDMIQLQTQVQQLQDAVARLQQSNDERMGVLKDLVQQTADSVNKMSVTVNGLQAQHAEPAGRHQRQEPTSSPARSSPSTTPSTSSRPAWPAWKGAHRHPEPAAVHQRHAQQPSPGRHPRRSCARGPSTKPLRALPNQRHSTDSGTDNSPAPKHATKRPPGPASSQPSAGDMYRGAYADYMSAKLLPGLLRVHRPHQGLPRRQPLRQRLLLPRRNADAAPTSPPPPSRTTTRSSTRYPDNAKIPAAQLHKAQALIDIHQTKPPSASSAPSSSASPTPPKPPRPAPN